MTRITSSCTSRKYTSASCSTYSTPWEPSRCMTSRKRSHPPTQVDQIALEAEQRLDGRLAGGQHDLVLQRVYALVEQLEGGLQGLHHPFADVVGDEARPAPPGEHLAPHPLHQLLVVGLAKAPHRDEPARAQKEPQFVQPRQECSGSSSGAVPGARGSRRQRSRLRPRGVVGREERDVQVSENSSTRGRSGPSRRLFTPISSRPICSRVPSPPRVGIRVYPGDKAALASSASRMGGKGELT